MARTANQKLKILLLQEVLMTRSDEEHPLSVSDLIAHLEAAGLTAERKSIYTDLETLREWGVDIQCRKGRGGGWFVGQRDFELPELKLLVDAVQSSKFITRKKSDALIKKLESLASRHQAGQLQRQVYVDRRVKTMNEAVYYSIDKLHAAVGANRAVTFQYFDYNVKKERILRREGRRYVVFPKGLLWDNENYYLAGWDTGSGQLRHYRVDKMADLVVTGLKPEPGQCDTLDLAAYGTKHFGMFSGQVAPVRLRCQNNMVGVILDRFGQEAMLIPADENHFTVTVEAAVSPQFFGWMFGLNGQVKIEAPQWAVRQWEEQILRVNSEK